MTEFPPFKLDPVNQCLWRSNGTGRDERVELRPKTFDVLRYLVENPGRLITHDELLDELWHAADVQQDILKAHILIIRKALDDVAREPQPRAHATTRMLSTFAAEHSNNPPSIRVAAPARGIRPVVLGYI